MKESKPAKERTAKSSSSRATNGPELSSKQCQQLLTTWKARFEENRHRHQDLEWAEIQARLEANPQKFWSLSEMERTGGEPDVVGYDKTTGEYTFYDCSAETPQGRRNVCYDGEGQRAREKQGLHPAGNVIDMAASMGIEPLTEEQYQALQKLGEFDSKTQSWLKTPPEVRKLGGALFANRHFGRVFVYANTAPCFYRGRAFRGALKV